MLLKLAIYFYNYIIIMLLFVHTKKRIVFVIFLQVPRNGTFLSVEEVVEEVKIHKHFPDTYLPIALMRLKTV